MDVGACQVVHWIFNNMYMFVDCNLHAALPAAALNMQLPVPIVILALALSVVFYLVMVIYDDL